MKKVLTLSRNRLAFVKPIADIVYKSEIGVAFSWCEMKQVCFSLFIFFLSFSANAQSFSDMAIDAYVRGVNAKTPKALSKKLTEPYTSDREKVRAIFRWITEHIAYNTIVYQKPSRSILNRNRSYETADDTSVVLLPLNERVAQLVLDRRVAVCDGYARLFKTLCDYAGIRSEIIYGYARTNYMRAGKRFFSNHTWNAVYIDKAWHLLDATWASGYITFGDEFIKQFNEAYYFAPPQQFIDDHYPELIFWSLLPSPPTLREFQFSPFKNQAFIKFKIESYKPASGIIEAAVGDTLAFELETNDEERKLYVSANPYFEFGLLPQLRWLPYISPSFTQLQNKVSFQYIVPSPEVKQLHVIYNDRVILQYKVHIRNNWAVK